ncbi:response regulator transcription factor [Paraburkholderia domus]|uniref:response regulator transcription factor n=1 Tax=Paraburkholderia domus TaxID=2793075 RepID=UPI0019144211|nr:response regulator transcription factor [Paraburkholderia domus]MBK5063085.1 response regulator transcription factor [Burkholderia sp. R-70199]CAE6916354.1 Transcriptional regulatory protein RcsB [Paraburkholderia domus]
MIDNAESSTPVRAIIADDHPLVLLAIENLMVGYPNMQIVGRAADATELFKEVDRIPCDLVLMDLYMPGGLYGDGLETVRQLKLRYPDVPLVVLTMETEAAALKKVIALGADGLISKRDRIDLIHVAVVTVLAHECYLGPAVRSMIADATVMQRLDFVRQMLSRRELEVFTLYASGLGVTEIATRVGRSVKTISAQKCTAMRKLALHSDSELFRFAVEYGVISEDGLRNRR